MSIFRALGIPGKSTLNAITDIKFSYNATLLTSVSGKFLIRPPCILHYAVLCLDVYKPVFSS